MTALFRRSIYRLPTGLRERYRHLYEAKREETPDGRRFERARLWRRGGVNVLHLVGDRFEMAFQHGRLLAEEIAEGTLEQTGLVANHGIENSLGNGPLARVAKWYARWGIAEPMLQRGARRAAEKGEESLMEGYGLAEGSGVPVRTIFHAPIGPEVAQTLLGRTSGVVMGADPLQCTSFTAWGSQTKTGEIIIGRNTDYPLTGYFDRHPTVIYFDPTDTKQRYMCVTSAGCHNGTTGGMNASGIYLACHTVPASTVSETGNPVMMVGQAVLREATTLEEAEAIINEAKPAAGWNFHVVSVKERRSATFELSSVQISRLDARREVHCTTNHYRQPEMQGHNLFVNNTVEIDTRARMARCEKLIAEAGGTLDAKTAAKILGDKHDDTVGRLRSGPNCVSASTTVSSSVWLPESGHLFVAGTGGAPMSQNVYVELPTVDGFDAETFESDGYRTIDNDHVRKQAPWMLQAEQKYLRAREAYDHQGDVGAAIELLQEAVELHEDPTLFMHLALYSIRAGRFDLALTSVDAVIGAGWDPERTRVARYLRGRLLAHEGHTQEARRELAAVASDPETNPRLAVVAKKLNRRIAKKKRVELGRYEIPPMSFMPDAFRYAGVVTAL